MQLRVDFANISGNGPLTYLLQLFQKGVHVKRLGAELPGKKGDHFLPFALAEQRLAESRFAGWHARPHAGNDLDRLARIHLGYVEHLGMGENAELADFCAGVHHLSHAGLRLRHKGILRAKTL